MPGRLPGCGAAQDTLHLFESDAPQLGRRGDGILPLVEDEHDGGVVVRQPSGPWCEGIAQLDPERTWQM